MKVLYITNIPSPYRVDFFNEMGKLCELTVVYERKQASDREWQKQEAVYYQEIYLEGKQVRNDAAFAPSVLSVIKKTDYEVLIIGGYSTPTAMYAIRYLHAKRLPFVLNADGGFVREEKKLATAVKRYFISKASAWLSTGDMVDDYLVHYGAKKEKIFRYPFTSVRRKDMETEPVTKEQQKKLREKLSLPEKKIVLTVGQMIPRKAPDVLIRAALTLDQDAGIYLIGGKPGEEEERLVKELGVQKRIHFLEFMAKEELREYYLAADVFVLPTREDAWGLVINEAVACGLPVVTTHRCIAGMEMLREGRNGFLVPTEEPEQLAEAVNRILKDQELEKSMRVNNLELAKHYSIEEMAKTHLNILKELQGRL